MRTCPNCHTGYLQPRTINYGNWHAGQYVVVPHLPAWSCDVCALCQIDTEALQRLLPLIGPVTQPDPSQPRRAAKRHLPAAEPLHDETDSDRDRRPA
jgi:YgiT-type zinc finger domain-containing protein